MSDTAYPTFQHYGTAAERGAFTPSPAGGTQPIYIWYETDTGSSYLYDTSWHPITTGGGSAVTLIAESLAGSDVASVSFTSIPSVYRHLQLICHGRLTETATDNYIKIQFNGDSGANYDSQQLQGVGSGTASASTYGQTSGRIGDWSAASATTANQASGTDIIIPHYAGTTFDKNCTSTGGCKFGTSGSTIFSSVFHVQWRSTAAITRIDIIPSANNIKTGSLFSLYGFA